jgi:hypothetical protein
MQAGEESFLCKFAEHIANKTSLHLVSGAKEKNDGTVQRRTRSLSKKTVLQIVELIKDGYARILIVARSSTPLKAEYIFADYFVFP